MHQLLKVHFIPNEVARLLFISSRENIGYTRTVMSGFDTHNPLNIANTSISVHVLSRHLPTFFFRCKCFLVHFLGKNIEKPDLLFCFIGPPSSSVEGLTDFTYAAGGIGPSLTQPMRGTNRLRPSFVEEVF